MIQAILIILRAAQERTRRAVVLVPEASYEESLKALGCLYPNNTGRTAQMPNGELVSLMTPKTPVEEAGEKFDLYLSGWGKATPHEERAMVKWTAKATAVYTEIS